MLSSSAEQSKRSREALEGDDELPEARVIERSYYDALSGIIRSKGGESVQEVEYKSVPDIIFTLQGTTWILSVKIGQTNKIVKDAFIQYLQHKDDTGISNGIVLFIPESSRRVEVREQSLRDYLSAHPVQAIIDTALVKTEIGDRSFTGVLDFIMEYAIPAVPGQAGLYFPMKRVVSLLQEQLVDLMTALDTNSEITMAVISDPALLVGLGQMRPDDATEVARFLACYIFLSQLIFMRLLSESGAGIVPRITSPSRSSLSHAFGAIRAIDYRPIYKFDVLDAIREDFIVETFRLVWGLQVEKVRYELPGRIFQELMPKRIRKMMAAFYTRPPAAELLAQLAIDKAESSIMDLACGSGTILTAAYRQKKLLWDQRGLIGNPHERFCEDEITGADIMPFAVHIASANLASMDPGTIIHRTRIIHGDSLRLTPSQTYHTGLNLTLFPETGAAEDMNGNRYDIELRPVDVVMMNPPFTKVERGIARFVNMDRFGAKSGREVGLWGHFVFLGGDFLRDDGTYAAVLPINVLRGRESSKVRALLFREWTVLYVVKPTRNYAFSESSEYRDILVVAKKAAPRPDDIVKFCLVKKSLARLTPGDITSIASTIRNSDSDEESDLVDVERISQGETQEHFDNMMWFCGVTSSEHRKVLTDLVGRFGSLAHFHVSGVREGFRPVPQGVSKFLFATRSLEPERTEEAFLRFDHDDRNGNIECTTKFGVSIDVRREHFLPSLRTTVGLRTMDITGKTDYVAKEPYEALPEVCRASGVRVPGGDYWAKENKALEDTATKIVVSRRLNPFSPGTSLLAFYADQPFFPSNQLNVLTERDAHRAKALCAVMNSIVFLTQFFLLKEESTGRLIDIRFYDLAAMRITPPAGKVAGLEAVFEAYRSVAFPSLRNQLDTHFDERYEVFKTEERRQDVLFPAVDDITPDETRVQFDLDICAALGLRIGAAAIRKVYQVIVEEMMSTKSLTKTEYTDQ